MAKENNHLIAGNFNRAYSDDLSAHNKALIIGGTSGVGKSTMISLLIEDYVNTFGFSISATTRKLRGKEVNGKDYFSMSIEEFHEKVKQGAFAERDQSANDNWYGTLRSEIDRIQQDCQIPLFDVNPKGAVALAKHFLYGDVKKVYLFATPEVARARLIERGTDTLAIIEQRIQEAQEQHMIALENKHLFNLWLDTSFINAQSVYKLVKAQVDEMLCSGK